MLDLDAGNSLPPPNASNDGSFQPEELSWPSARSEAEDLLTIERRLEHSTVTPIADDRSNGEPEKIAYYIQVVERDQVAVLRTNLPRTDTVKPTEQGVAWLLGRSRNCTIVFPDPAISRCHAVLSYQPGRGFQLMDAGSSNGTFLNRKRLIAMEPHRLQDGDLITVSHISLKLFILRSTT
ncbi:MAG: FHA domain-containing protein [Alkalinema sp. RL_2_19]|nr:FHA domain-containing protein [Alkalinema sp. RL_2_19]